MRLQSKRSVQEPLDRGGAGRSRCPTMAAPGSDGAVLMGIQTGSPWEQRDLPGSGAPAQKGVLMAVILVVDDHPHILRLLQRELEGESHEVITTATGEEALRKIHEELPALVVLDVMLPGKDGLSVLRELRADPATQAMVVILLTARDEPGDVARGLQRGADWYVAKPFRPGDIATLVRRFLDPCPGPAAAFQSGGDRLPNVEIDRLTM